MSADVREAVHVRTRGDDALF